MQIAVFTGSMSSVRKVREFLKQKGVYRNPTREQVETIVYENCTAFLNKKITVKFIHELCVELLRVSDKKLLDHFQNEYRAFLLRVGQLPISEQELVYLCIHLQLASPTSLKSLTFLKSLLDKISRPLLFLNHKVKSIMPSFYRLPKALWVFIIFSMVFLSQAPQAGAFFWDDWIKNAQHFVQTLTKDPDTLTLQSEIKLSSEGDYDKNGEIDSGDVVTFHYTVTNPTKNEYPFVTLITNIPRNNLNFIHDVRGTASLSDDGKTIIIPNLRIPPQGEVIISFNARINYSPDSLDISTEPELMAEDKKSLVKSVKKEVKAKPWKKTQFPGMIKIQTK